MYAVNVYTLDATKKRHVVCDLMPFQVENNEKTRSSVCKGFNDSLDAFLLAAYAQQQHCHLHFDAHRGIVTSGDANSFRRSRASMQRDKKLLESGTEGSDAALTAENHMVKVQTFQDAFQTVTAQSIVVFIIMSTYASVICLGLCMPILAGVPGGFFDSEGLFKFISIGFKQHTALASLMYGLCMPLIGFMRFFAIIMYITSPFRALLYSVLLVIGLGAGIVTVRYDVVVDLHFVAAAVWISSSLIFYALVGAFNKHYSSVNGGLGMKIVWACSIVCAILFLTFVILFNTSSRDKQYFLIAGVNEYLTAFFILVMDFLMAFSIHSRFLNGVDLLSEIFARQDSTSLLAK
jgi:hypothetical protein